jgi:hypothetical protein
MNKLPLDALRLTERFGTEFEAIKAKRCDAKVNGNVWTNVCTRTKGHIGPHVAFSSYGDTELGRWVCGMEFMLDDPNVQRLGYALTGIKRTQEDLQLLGQILWWEFWQCRCGCMIKTCKACNVGFTELQLRS